MNKTLFYGAILVATVVAPFLFPAYGTQLATLWLMIIVALTWDMTGGQMGYNSLGNIFFYGTGMYVISGADAIQLSFNTSFEGWGGEDDEINCDTKYEYIEGIMMTTTKTTTTTTTLTYSPSISIVSLCKQS